MKYIDKIRKLFSFPYTGFEGFFILHLLILKFLPKRSFPGISIVKDVIEHFSLSDLEEFRVRYYISRIDFEEVWNSRMRNTQKDIESFYNEHDKDIWRQAYLSHYFEQYKKKILRSLHVAKKHKASVVLDYGCGSGVLAQYLSKNNYIVDVADIQSRSLNFVTVQLGKNFRNIYLINQDVKLPQQEYDIVFALDVLEHTFEPLSITKKLLKTVKKEGLLYLSFPKEKYFNFGHTEEAQMERAQVFSFLKDTCKEIIAESIYQKINNDM